MLKITCDHEHLEGNVYQLRPWEHWRLVDTKPVCLAGPWGALWESILQIAALPSEEQLTFFKGANRKARAKLLRGIGILKRAGLVSHSLDEDALDPRDDGIPRLQKLHMELTYRCNFKCKACYLGARLKAASSPKDREVSTGQWLKTVEEAASLGCTHAVVTGGEPFLRRDIVDILQCLTENGITTTINTNGSCITAQIAAKLKPILLNTVDITLYGSDRLSAGEYTSNQPGFSSAVKAVFHLLEHDVPVSVKYFATKANIAGMDEVFDTFRTEGIRVKLIGHAIHGDIFENKTEGGHWIVQDLERPKKVIQGGNLPCHPTGTVLNIEPDGAIRACPKVAVHFGNVFRDGLTHVWTRSQAVNDFRNYWRDYTKAQGYVKGAAKGSLCPASNMLSQKDGLKDFRKGWESYRMEV